MGDINLAEGTVLTEEKMKKLQNDWNKEKELKKMKAKMIKKPNH